MGQVGTFGPIVFEVSDKKVLTFTALKQSVLAQYSDHKLINQKPKKEYVGAGLRSIKFSITLDATLGVRPQKMLTDLEYITESGYADYLVIGDKSIGDNRFCITNISEAWDVVYSGGELAKATVEVTMEEYT